MRSVGTRRSSAIFSSLRFDRQRLHLYAEASPVDWANARKLTQCAGSRLRCDCSHALNDVEPYPTVAVEPDAPQPIQVGLHSRRLCGTRL